MKKVFKKSEKTKKIFEISKTYNKKLESYPIPK